jgi:hypothetical protein
LLLLLGLLVLLCLLLLLLEALLLFPALKLGLLGFSPPFILHPFLVHSLSVVFSVLLGFESPTVLKKPAIVVPVLSFVHSPAIVVR